MATTDLPYPPVGQSPSEYVRDQVLLRIAPAVAVRLNPRELSSRIEQLRGQIADERRLLLNQAEQRGLTTDIVNDMIGLGPLEPLLRDETVSGTLVNGASEVC